ncbi:methyltransferase family protein [Fulvivirga ligni]|uniref:methyltransferase family protein n=1 Tax=Fulvivirga ligni TaxID=2904246 RepID=UPI001F4094AB|nr:isoprenylcysteine carboxylmethyltransferase family protein [Fulvivirga ligni]UII22778.1 isoprenylcysteine carboxylmethyltransferase family protein [Fulvivirga ligni]
MEFKISYIILAVAWAVYLFIHSAMASGKVSSYAMDKLGISFKSYRMTYNVIATVGLLFLLFYNATISSPKLIPLTNLVKYISLFMAGVGVIIINVSFRQYSARGFLGLQEESYQRLQTGGILAHIRHPLYTATILIVLGYFLYDSRLANLVTAVCVLVYLPIGIYFEEKKLIKTYGDEYLDYKERVPSLIPSIKLFF